MYFNMATREKRAAIVENGKVVEVIVDQPHKKKFVHNIYVGKVVNVLPGMQAAFVNIGEEKNGFLYRDDILTYALLREEEKEKKERNISSFITEGETVVVQVEKEGFGSKGPKLTGVVSFPGKYIVYMPTVRSIGVSRRIVNEKERDKWFEVSNQMLLENEGIIIRTACEGESVELVERELKQLRALWQSIEEKMKQYKAPALVYEGANLMERLVRDFTNVSIDEIVIDEPASYFKLKQFVRPYPEMEQVVQLYRGKENIFSFYGIEKQLEKALKRQVWLKSGAYMTFDQTEALTVIDVNTGKFIGKTNLRDTIVKANEEAAIEIVRQLRLRNISGIIIIDFIDMKQRKDRERMMQKFKSELRKDRMTTSVKGFTTLGLVEMTRKKVRESYEATVTKKCPTCLGNGVVLSDDTLAFNIERHLWEYYGMESEALVLEMPAAVVPVLVGEEGIEIQQLESELGFRIFVHPNEKMDKHTFHIRYIGTVKEAAALVKRLT